MLIRADLHLHTNASADALMTPEELIRLSQEHGLGAIAVTDHNCLAGALTAARLAPPGLRVIVGEEVLSRNGEILGLFLKEKVAPGMDAFGTARAIRAQGGLVGAPHPLDPWRHALGAPVLEALYRSGLLDFVEARNCRVLRRRFNEEAEEWARRRGIPCSAGSDAHTPTELGHCTVLMAAFATPQEFLAALREGELQGKPWLPWARVVNSVRRRLGI